MAEADISIRIMDILTEDQREALEALGKPVRFPAGQTIFWQGQPSHSALLIQHGSVKITKPAVDGKEIILAIRGAMELMGEEGALLGDVRAAAVTTITEVIGLDISAEQLLAFVEERRLWPQMYRAAVRRRRQGDARVVLTRLDVRSRLAGWLVELAKHVGAEADEGWVIESTLSQEDLAGRIGASRDMVASVLRDLRHAGLVSTARGRIVLHDLEELRQISSN